MPRTTKLPSAQRGRLIDEAATSLFAERGYASSSVEEIVTRAGVTKPMLYRHYESKQELCIALLERYRDELIAATLRELGGDRGPLAAADTHPPDVRGELERMVDAWLSWVEAHPQATRLLFTPILGDPEVQRVQQDLFRRQRDTQAALLREFVPSLSSSDAEPLAEITRAGFAAVALWWLENAGQPRAVARRALMSMAAGIVTAADNPNTR